MTGYGYVSLFVCSSSQSEGSAFPFPNFSILRADFFAWIIAGCWQTASQMLDQWTLRDDVIGCTQSLLPCSLWTYQSNLTYVFKAVLLAACSSCHGNLNAISPHCLYRSISWKLFFFFFCLGLLKLARPPVNKRLRLCFAWFVCKWVCVWMIHICACMGVSFIWPSEQTQTRCWVCAPVWTGLMLRSINCGKALKSSESTFAFQSLLGRMGHHHVLMCSCNYGAVLAS